MSGVPDESTSPETLAPTLTRAVGQLLRRLRADANPGGLNFSQSAALATLDESGGMTTADLARAESMKPQSMSAILASLEQEGLVERRPHPTDGRQILFSLTAQGVEARRQRAAAKQEWLAGAIAKLSPTERQTLVSAAALIRKLSGA
jgi:DNA-binding MarR family transcriptional regulator